MPTSELILGAALPIEKLQANRDWLLEHGGRDLEIQDAFRSEVLDGDWNTPLQRIKTALDGHQGRVGVHGPFDGLHIGSFDPVVREFVAKRYLKTLDFIGAIGDAIGNRQPHMVLHSPFLFFGHPNVAHTEATGLRQQLEFVCLTLEPVVAKAKALGCTIVVENIRDTNTRPLLELVRMFKTEHVRMSLDAGHANLMLECGGPKADQWVRDAGEYLGHVHLQDNDGMLDHHWSPGRGTINWWAVMTEIAKLEHRPRLILEIRDHELAWSANWFKEQSLAQ